MRSNGYSLEHHEVYVAMAILRGCIQRGWCTGTPRTFYHHPSRYTVIRHAQTRVLVILEVDLTAPPPPPPPPPPPNNPLCYYIYMNGLWTYSSILLRTRSSRPWSGHTAVVEAVGVHERVRCKTIYHLPTV